MSYRLSCHSKKLHVKCFNTVLWIGSDDLALWQFVIKHSTWLFNQVLNHITGLSLIEMLTKTSSYHHKLLRTHVWGCPTFMLDPKMYYAQKTQVESSCLDGTISWIFNQHISLMANTRTLRTGYLSPYFHVVIDDLFQTIFSCDKNDMLFDVMCNQLFHNNQNCYA